MDRYIASQLISPSKVAVGLVSVLGVAIGYLSDLADKVVDSNLPLMQALEIVLLESPRIYGLCLAHFRDVKHIINLWAFE